MKIEYLADYKEYVRLVNDWQFEQWGRYYEDSSRKEWLTRLKDRLNKEEVPTVLIAFKGGDPVGTASLLKHDMGTYRDYSPWLADVYVKPEYRNQGIGTKLIKRAVKEARRIGVKRIYLFTRDKKRLYLNLGWQLLETVEYNNKIVDIMVIDLTD
ncbi:GNAT family N-acetyltransferase [Halanaerobaculum tunisiense]